jgi:orotate phosphoribosyltransferase
MISVVWFEEKQQLGKEIIRSLYQNGMILTWYKDRPDGWWLRSGARSPYYINLRPISSLPVSSQLLKTVGTAMGRMIKEEAPQVNKIVGIAAAGVPLATAVTMQEGIPACYTRKLYDVETIEDFEEITKGHGQHEQIEGELNDGDVLALLDDLVTKFGSMTVANEQVKYNARGRNINVTCKNAAVLLDREQGAEETAKELGFKLHSIIRFKTDGFDWLKGLISQTETDVITDYMENDVKYQDKKLWEELRKMAIKKT